MADNKVKIKLRTSLGGNWEGQPFAFASGEEVEVPEGLAKDLTRGGVNAELVRGKAAAKTATAKHTDKTTR